MPVFLGIPLIGWIQMVFGTAVVLFALIKYLRRPKMKKADGFLIRDVHVIIGDGSELFHQNVLVRGGIIKRISSDSIEDAVASVIDGTGLTLMPGLIDSHIHIQGGFSCRNEEESDAFMRERIPQIFSEGVLPYGVTTIKDLDAPKHFIYKLRDKLKSGEITGPELLIVGPNFTAPGGHPASTLGSNSLWAKSEMAIEVSTPEQVSEGIRELKEAGVDFLKFTYQGGDYWYFDEKRNICKIDKTLMQQIIREGKENGLRYQKSVIVGKKPNGKYIKKSVYGKTQKELITPDTKGNLMSGIAERNAWKAFMNHINVCAGGSKGAGPKKPVWVIDKITAHMLRHTYATMLFDAGVDVKSAQRFLGHTDIEVTLSIYTHLTKFKEEQAIQMLDKHLKEIKKEPEKRLLRVL